MASLSDVLQRGKGVAGAWRVRTDYRESVEIKILYHYTTAMLKWRADNPADEDYLDYSTGWGSVSDQQGMNKAFRILGIPRYFSRAGGAEIR